MSRIDHFEPQLSNLTQILTDRLHEKTPLPRIELQYNFSINNPLLLPSFPLSSPANTNLIYCLKIKYLFCYSLLQISFSMNTPPQSKQHHWKLLMNRKNRIEVAFQAGLNKLKYTPLRDNSMRDSKIFQRSRERSSSSMIGANKTKDGDNVSVKSKPQQKVTQSIKGLHRDNSVLVSTIKISEFKGTESIVIGKYNNTGMNYIIDLQKQFKSFKENIFKQLQRQQQVINKLARQMVGTFQYELSKLKLNKCDKCLHSQACLPQVYAKQTLEQKKYQKTKFNSKQQKQKRSAPRVKQIEQIKQQINKQIQKFQLPKTQSKTSILTKNKPLQQFPAMNLEPLQNKFDNFFQILNKLKSDMNQIQALNQASSSINSPMVTQQKDAASSLQKPAKK